MPDCTGPNQKSMTKWTQKASRWVATDVLRTPGTDGMIQTVRRDNCRLVSTVIETCLHKMLIDRDVKGAEECVLLGWNDALSSWLTIRASYTKQMISDLLQNKVDMSQLVITKALAKTGRHEHRKIERYCRLIRHGDYTGKQAHVELAEKMKQRDAGTCKLKFHQQVLISAPRLCAGPR